MRKQRGVDKKQDTNPTASKFTPLTDNQRLARDYFNSGKNLALVGCAGTGKTFLACSLAASHLQSGECSRVRLLRSAVPTRDMGFLPGTTTQKTEYYERPLIDAFNTIYGRGDAYMIMKQKGAVHFESTSYLRGTTFQDEVLIVDEIQNMTLHELDTVITRLGGRSRIIFCGDIRQSDLVRETPGFVKFMEVLGALPEWFRIVSMGVEDIVRGGLVKDYIKVSNKIY